MNESVIYQEEQLFYPWLMVLIIIAFGVSILIPLFLGASFWKNGGWIGMLTFGILLIVFWGFRKLRVLISPTQLLFGFPFWKARLSLSEITAVEIVTLPAMAGIGVHYWRRKTYFNARMGRGIGVSTPRRAYVIGSDDPEKLADMLKSAINSTKPLA